MILLLDLKVGDWEPACFDFERRRVEICEFWKKFLENFLGVFLRELEEAAADEGGGSRDGRGGVAESRPRGEGSELGGEA